jgi:DNA helicase-2/ATP-dependent DNA helicase PcrA
LLTKVIIQQPVLDTIDAFGESLNGLDKGDWLADSFFQMKTEPVARYAGYIANNAAYSTQHGVKGEEYEKVMVVYDDAEAALNQYSFNKVLTPLTAGEPTERQRSLTQKLAYISFSRVMEDLRGLMFTTDPVKARSELINSKLLRPDQISVVTYGPSAMLSKTKSVKDSSERRSYG